ncbi:MAG TPA: AraC family transcriptional regulator [Longimicrobiaceae bacterium]|nr:AraC family transcriptional regulator [Longimicrobiaceae bacterium]
MDERAPVASSTLLSGPGIKLIRVDYAGGLHQRVHAHEHTSVSLILAGSVEERVGPRTVDGRTLSVVVKPAGVEHACRYGRVGLRTLSLELDPGRLERLAAPREEVREWRWIRKPGTAAGVLEVYRMAAAGRFARHPEDVAIELLAALGERGPPGGSRPPPWVLEAEEELRETGRRPPIRELAARAGVHPVHLARAFRRHFGRSPTAHARWLRLQRAAEALLGNPESRIGSVAHQCAFSDQSHMCREFRDTLGVSPSVFRRLGRAVEE